MWSGCSCLGNKGPWATLSHVLTVVRNDAPGHGRCIDAPGHPEDAQPTEVLPSLLPRQEFREIGKNNGQSPTNAAEESNARKNEVTH